MDVRGMTKEEQAEACYQIIKNQMAKICERCGVSQQELAESLIAYGQLPWYRRTWFRIKLWFMPEE